MGLKKQENLQIIVEFSKRLVTIPLNGRSDKDLTKKTDKTDRACQHTEAKTKRPLRFEIKEIYLLFRKVSIK